MSWLNFLSMTLINGFDLWQREELFVSKIGNETCSSSPGGCGGCDAKVH
jgi:hypothetical protein